MVFKCKMCDATLNIQAGENVTVCEYCGSKQSLPRFSDERIMNLYSRADHYRKNNEFDKAQALYEQILEENATDPEVYWSVILCKYGIEYVEEEGSNKRIPTVNRTQTTSVLNDLNYRKALENASPEQKTIYEEEAKTIDRIQKNILAISEKEEPFDIFICYKESDEHGRRTLDSVLAMDLYEKLTDEGYKVFYARVTLDDKFGEAYEPYIYAALQSSQIMIVVGTKPEHFNAVWVKNEWSRYLAMIKGGSKKTLIPAYKDMDPYDMPVEFSHLQALNMAELGFHQDLIHGIRKIFIKEEKIDIKPVTGNVQALVDRGFLLLEDGDWNHAGECLQKALDDSPRNAEAFLGMLMVELKIKYKEDLSQSEVLFDENKNYRMVLRYGDEELRNFVIRANNNVKENAGNKIYEETLRKLENAIMPDVIMECAKVFEGLGDFRDSAQLVERCKEKAAAAEERQKEDMFRFYCEMMDSDDPDKWRQALNYFEVNPKYKNCKDKASELRKRLEKKQMDEDYMLEKSSRASALSTAAVEAAEFLTEPDYEREARRRKQQVNPLVYVIIIGFCILIFLLEQWFGIF